MSSPGRPPQPGQLHEMTDVGKRSSQDHFLPLRGLQAPEAPVLLLFAD